MTTIKPKRKLPIPSKPDVLIKEVTKNCKIIFLSNKADDNKYTAVGIIIEKTLRYLIKFRDKDFNFRKASVDKMIIRANTFNDFPKSFGGFLSKFWEKRNYEVHEGRITLNPAEIDKLRNNIFKYLDWFFRKVLNEEVPKELSGWAKLNSLPPLKKKVIKRFHKKTMVSDHHLKDKLKKLIEGKETEIITAKPVLSGKNLIMKLNSENEFSRNYFKDIIINRSELRGITLTKPNQDLSGLKLEVEFKEGKVSILNRSEKIKILFNDSPLVRNRKKILPEGHTLLTIDGIQFTIILNQY